MGLRKVVPDLRMLIGTGRWKKMRNKNPKFAILVIFLFVTATITAILFDYVRGIGEKKRCTTETTGIVTDVFHHTGKHNHGTVATIEFKAGGILYVIKEKCPYGEREGNSVIVHYNPENPKDSYAYDNPSGIRTFKSRMGAFFILLPLWIFVCISGIQKMKPKPLNDHFSLTEDQNKI